MPLSIRLIEDQFEVVKRGIDDTDDLSLLGSDSLPTLDSDEKDKITALLVAEDDVAHDRAWHELPHEHRLIRCDNVLSSFGNWTKNVSLPKPNERGI